MRQLNTPGAELAERGLVHAGVDVTGFGLLGHLGSMCRASKVGAEIFVDRVPVLSKEIWELIRQKCVPGGSRDNLAFAEQFTQWNAATDEQKTLLADAQTSGGLLLSVAPRQLERVMRALKRFHTPCATVIGRIVRSAKPKIEITNEPSGS